MESFSELTYFLQQHTALLLTVTALFGLVVGSFHNVVIHRLPIMMKKDWDAQCREYLNTSAESQDANTQALNLFTPASHCTHCNTRIRAWHNIPILSYLFLKGKCAHCNTKISSRYLFVEILTALLSVTTIWFYGLNAQAMMALIFTWSLISLAFIDYEHQFLPDVITIPMIWIGLLVNIDHSFVSTSDSIIGAVAGYMSLWIIAKSYYLITKKEGLGHGDFKLLAMLGAWMGWQLLPVILFLSSVCGAMISLTLIACKITKREQPIPFGPYLAAAGWVALLWGRSIMEWYLEIILQF